MIIIVHKVLYVLYSINEALLHYRMTVTTTITHTHTHTEVTEDTRPPCVKLRKVKKPLNPSTKQNKKLTETEMWDTFLKAANDGFLREP